MTIWFTSDLHFSHENIIKFCNRPFKDVSHMNEMLIKNYNDRVGPKDMVVFVGDVCMGQRDQTLPLVKRLNGFKILVPGNHDNCHVMHSTDKAKWENACRLYGEYFDSIITDDVYVYQDFVVCHFPYSDGDKDYQGRDFSEYEPMDIGMPLLSGHVHDSWKTKTSKKGTFMLNIGVDVHSYAPISFEEITAIYHDYY